MPLTVQDILDDAPVTDTQGGEDRDERAVEDTTVLEHDEPVVVDQDPADVDVVDEPEVGEEPAETVPAPRILLLGEPDILDVGGSVEPSKRARLLEYGAYLAVNSGSSAAAIDDAIWPNRKSEDNTNTRNTATSKLGSWRPRRLERPHPGDPFTASTPDLNVAAGSAQGEGRDDDAGKGADRSDRSDRSDRGGRVEGHASVADGDRRAVASVGSARWVLVMRVTTLGAARIGGRAG